MSDPSMSRSGGLLHTVAFVYRVSDESPERIYQLARDLYPLDWSLTVGYDRSGYGRIEMKGPSDDRALDLIRVAVGELEVVIDGA